MQPRTSSRSQGARRAQSFALLTPEGEFTLTVNSIAIGDHDVDSFERPIPELPGRDGLDFRDPGYRRDA